jgi:hypothetical protein
VPAIVVKYEGMRGKTQGDSTEARPAMSINHPNFGMIADDRVIIFDTTLRDGEQSPGFSMNLDEKLRMAEALAELGVDVIEAGFPIASIGDFESVQRIAQSIRGPVITGLARSGRDDILRAAEAVKPAERKRIHTFISTSPLHMKYKLRMEPDAVLEAVGRSVALARDFTDDVEWSAEDGSRTEPDFLCRCVEAAIKAGATTINIPDTVGYSVPEDIARIFTTLRTRVPGADGVIFRRIIITILVSLLLTHWPRRAPVPGRSNARSTGSASGRAMQHSKKWSWRSAPGMMRCRSTTGSIVLKFCGRRSCLLQSPGSMCSRTRRSWGATPLRMKAAFTRTAC